jgi:CheY-like chemotaxis protein
VLAIKNRYDLAIVDAPLSEAEHLAKNFPPPKIILIASFLEWNKIEGEANLYGIRHFLARPVFMTNLLDVVNKAMGKKPSKDEAAQTACAETPDFRGVTALLAEDIAINREIFRALLEDTDIAIDEAENGKAAVKMYEENPGRYDLIIMDVQMPEMDGIEATKIIRAWEKEKRSGEIPIIAMTANVFKEDIDKCLEAGMNDHLKKPVEEKALLAKIAHYAKR